MEPPSATNAEFNFLYPKAMAILITAIKIVRQSVMVSFPISKQMAMIMATDARFTASKNAENSFEFRIFLTICLFISSFFGNKKNPTLFLSSV